MKTAMLPVKVFQYKTRENWQESVPNNKKENLPQSGNKFFHSRTHRDSTQPVACIRGYEPSAHRCLLRTDVQAAFQATQKTKELLTRWYVTLDVKDQLSN